MPSIPQFQVEHTTRAGRLGAIVGAVFLVGLISVPFWAERATMRTIVEICYYLALAQMWNLMAGYAGLVSVGQQAYVGFGGYMLLTLSVLGNVHPLPALLLAGVLSAAIALPTAMIVFRLRGAYFAIGTWVMAEVYRLGFSQIRILGGGSGKSLSTAVVKSIAASRATREMVIYWVGLALAVGAVALVFFVLRSRHGLALTAIRDSEAAAESVGVDNFRTKLWVYLVTAFGTGIVGALILLQKLRISPEAGFSVSDWTVNVIFMVVIGGIGTIEGPFIGVLVFFLLREMLADLGSWYLILLGVVAVAVMLKAPQGIWGSVAERFDLHLFPVRRHLRVSPNGE